MMKPMILLPILVAAASSWLWLGALLALPTSVEPFLVYQTSPRQPVEPLFAAKKKKKKSRNPASGNAGSSFGGVAMEPCPCGSGETYSKCCGKVHRDVNTFKSATAEQIVRARYSAYAKKQPDFLMASTHPLNENFDTDLKKWKESIKLNMYDNFDMNECTILEEVYPTEDTAQVKFVARLVLRETGEVTAFMETSEFERAKTHGGWLYKNGTISAAPGAEGDDGNCSEQETSEETIEKLKENL